MSKSTTVNRRLNTSFWLGFIMNVGWSMWWQDMRGLEKTIQIMRLTWIELSPFWGLGIVIFAILVHTFSMDVNTENGGQSK